MKHTVRQKDHGVGGVYKVVDIENYTRGKAARLFCTECLGHEDHPKICCAKMCPLYPFRGKSELAWKAGRDMAEVEKSGYCT